MHSIDVVKIPGEDRMAGRSERHYEAQEAQVRVDFITDYGQYHAAHYVKGLEIVFLLNGNASVLLDGRSVNLVHGEFIVIGSGHVYELGCSEQFMEIRIRVDGEFLASKAALTMKEGQTGWSTRCMREELEREQLEPYLAICELFKGLTLLYVEQPAGFRLKTESVVLDILFLLIQHFTYPLYGERDRQATEGSQRIQEILDYIDTHYREDMPLGRIADHFSLSREYFSRLFRRMVGMSFYQHLTRVRISHFHHDLVTTDTPVMQLLEENGIANYKTFGKVFRQMYGFSPREIRKMA